MELTDPGARKFYYFVSMSISLAIFYGYSSYFRLIARMKVAEFQKFSWFLSLALSDVMIALNIAAGCFLIFPEHGDRTELGCHFYAWTSLGAGFVNLASAAFCALDRHRRVINPDYDDQNIGIKAFFLWIAGFATAALPLLGVGEYDHLTKDTAMCLINLQKSRVFVYSVAALWFVVPVAVMLTTYANLALKAKEYSKMAITTRVLLLCYTPYALHAVVTSTFGVTFPAPLTAINHLFPKLLSAINPHLYLEDPMIKQHLHGKVNKHGGDIKNANLGNGSLTSTSESNGNIKSD